MNPTSPGPRTLDQFGTPHGDFMPDVEEFDRMFHAVGLTWDFCASRSERLVQKSQVRSIPQGQTLAYSTQYTSQFASIQGGSAQAQALLLLHEIAHVFDMILPDSGSAANQAVNNDHIRRCCGSVIQSFSNKGPNQ